jgi:hypothetical protein
MEEKRRYKRYLIEGMDITCRMLFTTDVKILDMSLSGAAIELDKRLEMGSSYALKVLDEGKGLSLNGEVVWVTISSWKKNSKGETIPRYKAGLRFDNVLSEKGLEVFGFLSDKANVQQVSLRLGGVRMLLDSDDSVIDYPQTFSIKSISLGGIRVETEHPLPKDSTFPLELSLFRSEGPPIKCMGRVVTHREHPSGNPDLFEVSVEFLDMGDTDRLRLERFIGRLDTP